MWNREEFRDRAERLRRRTLSATIVAVTCAFAIAVALTIGLVVGAAVVGNQGLILGALLAATLLTLALLFAAFYAVRRYAVAQTRALELVCPRCGGRLADVTGMPQQTVLATGRCIHCDAELSAAGESKVEDTGDPERS